ncbi:MAG: COX15/CtaA family protein [Phycisphaerales bacterium]
MTNVRDSTATQPGFAVAIAYGLWVTAGQWGAAYIALMQPGRLVGEILFGVMILALALGAFLAAKTTRGGSGIAIGAGVGLVAAAFNALIIGSLVGSSMAEGRSAGAAVAIWSVGSFAAFAIIGGLSGLVGRRMAVEVRSERVADSDAVASVPLPSVYPRAGAAPALALYSKAVVVVTFMLIISGGIVTGYEAGLAVPDWPNSFGHNMILYPLTQMVSDERMAGGVHYEHAHRLYGMLVGLATITLVVFAWFATRHAAGRKLICTLSLFALVMVIIQGILGGTRVTESSTGLAIIHGIFGQMVLAVIAATACAASLTWRERIGTITHAGMRTDQLLSWLLIATLLVQLGLGAAYRHANGQPGVDPASTMGVLFVHIAMGLAVTAVAIICGLRGLSVLREQVQMHRTGGLLLLIVFIQLMLGITAMLYVLRRAGDEVIPISEVIATTAHQANGALLLMVATLHAMWSHRLLERE